MGVLLHRRHMGEKQTRLGVVIGCGNHKGGVAKSTLSCHLAAALGERALRVLIVDCDPGAGSTRIFGIDGKSFAGTFELVLGQDADPVELAVRDNMPTGVEIIPARSELNELRQYLSKFEDYKNILGRGIDRARNYYDVIICDTAPNAEDLLLVSTYLNAQWFLLSAFVDVLSMHGLNESLSDIADARAKRNPGLELLGVIVNAVDGRTKSWRQMSEIIAAHFPGREFSTVVSRTEAIPRAFEAHRTLFQIRKHRAHHVLTQYRAIAAEVHARIENRDAFIEGGRSAIPQYEPAVPETEQELNRTGGEGDQEDKGRSDEAPATTAAADRVANG